MILKNFYDTQLAQASYLVGCGQTGEAIVIDPLRNIDKYLSAAQEEGLQIVAVTETHIHADFVSGALELAQRTGAKLYLSDEGPADWKYAFAERASAQLLHDGDSIRVGGLRLDVVHTPGHTPEHISFVLTDSAASEKPYGAFTGDFLFVGDVGRPDLLERAAGFEGTMVEGARTLYDTIQKFRSYPDSMLIWPAHGAGSACGKSLGGVPTSAFGYEKETNWAFQIFDCEEFVHAVLAGQPEPPAYFKEMKRINKLGSHRVTAADLPRYAGRAVLNLEGAGAIVVDLRSATESATGTLPGAINLPLEKGFTMWAGSVLPFDAYLYLLAETQEKALAANQLLQNIGLDNARGWIGTDALKAWEADGRPLQRQASVGAHEATETPGEYEIVDVRGATEFAVGNIPGATNIPLGSLWNRASELQSEKPVIVHCAGGNRGPIAASILKHQGVQNVTVLQGGYRAYAKLAEK